MTNEQLTEFKEQLTTLIIEVTRQAYHEMHDVVLLRTDAEKIPEICNTLEEKLDRYEMANKDFSSTMEALLPKNYHYQIVDDIDETLKDLKDEGEEVEKLLSKTNTDSIEYLTEQLESLEGTLKRLHTKLESSPLSHESEVVREVEKELYGIVYGDSSILKEFNS